jgi:hypothetical protein
MPPADPPNSGCCVQIRFADGRASRVWFGPVRFRVGLETHRRHFGLARQPGFGDAVAAIAARMTG